MNAIRVFGTLGLWTTVVVGAEAASEGRADAEQGEELGRDGGAVSEGDRRPLISGRKSRERRYKGTTSGAGLARYFCRGKYTHEKHLGLEKGAR